VGPGQYDDKEKYDRMHKKPTTCKMVRPEFGDLDECYEIVNNTKILQPNYLSKTHRAIHDHQMDNNIQSKGRVARRFNESVYLQRTMHALE
jgi:hypothetical protein